MSSSTPATTSAGPDRMMLLDGSSTAMRRSSSGTEPTSWVAVPAPPVAPPAAPPDAAGAGGGGAGRPPGGAPRAPPAAPPADPAADPAADATGRRAGAAGAAAEEELLEQGGGQVGVGVLEREDGHPRHDRRPQG